MYNNIHIKVNAIIIITSHETRMKIKSVQRTGLIIFITTLISVGNYDYMYFHIITCYKLNKKLRYREEHSTSVVFSWCTL